MANEDRTKAQARLRAAGIDATIDYAGPGWWDITIDDAALEDMLLMLETPQV